jgi:hypothetical protein
VVHKVALSIVAFMCIGFLLVAILVEKRRDGVTQQLTASPKATTMLHDRHGNGHPIP